MRENVCLRECACICVRVPLFCLGIRSFSQHLVYATFASTLKLRWKTNADHFQQAETNAFLRCGEVFWVTVEDNPDPRHATVVLRFTFFVQKKRDYVMFYDFLEHYLPKVCFVL